ncbi:hypothetical protein N9B12_00405 [bacterium]|nr:hypothetical protein [bacterium]
MLIAIASLVLVIADVAKLALVFSVELLHVRTTLVPAIAKPLKATVAMTDAQTDC